MSKVKLVSFAIALGALSFGSFAAEQMTTQAAGSAAQATIVSARSALSSSAPGSLNEKAVPDGTRSYPMTSVSGQRNMHSTSVVYE